MLLKVRAIGVDGNLHSFSFNLTTDNFSFEHFVNDVTRINKKDFGCIDVYTKTIELIK